MFSWLTNILCEIDWNSKTFRHRVKQNIYTPGLTYSLIIHGEMCDQITICQDFHRIKFYKYCKKSLFFSNKFIFMPQIQTHAESSPISLPINAFLVDSINKLMWQFWIELLTIIFQCFFADWYWTCDVCMFNILQMIRKTTLIHEANFYEKLPTVIRDIK